MIQPFSSGTEPLVLAEGRDYLAVYKPCRLHSAPLARSPGVSLCSWVFERYPELSFPRPQKADPRASMADPSEGGLFHRLDFETSGIVLFARGPEALLSLNAAQERGEVLKDYSLVAAPSLSALAGSRPPRACPPRVDPLAWEEALRASSAGGGALALAALFSAAVGAGGVRVESRFRPFGPRAALVACLDPSIEAPRRRRGSPETIYASELLSLAAEGEFLASEVSIRRGFRHQIRAHFAWIGLPLLGDALYGGWEADRLYLHARRIRFPDPSTSRPINIECPLIRG